MEFLLALYKENPIVASTITVFLAGSFAWAIRNIPLIIWSFLLRQITTSVTFNNAGWGENVRQYETFMKWFMSTKGATWSRTLSANSRYATKEETLLGPGYGRHIFFHEGRLFWFTKNTLPSTGSEKEKEMISISTFGRNHAPIVQLFETFARRKDTNQQSIMAYGENQWSRLAIIQKRSLDTVVFDERSKKLMVEQLEHFTTRGDWYYARGMAHKLTYVLEGPPGTGKTSIVRAMASHFERDIYVLSLSGMTDAMFEKAVASVPKGSVILIEDFDSSRAVLSRDRDQSGLGSLADIASMLTLTGVLNVLDGVVALDDVVVFLTTNCIQDIDAAVIRKGRVDHLVHVGFLQNAEIRTYAKLMYPDLHIDLRVEFKPIAGCDIQAIFLEYREDQDGFLDALKQRSNTILQAA